MGCQHVHNYCVSCAGVPQDLVSAPCRVAALRAALVWHLLWHCHGYHSHHHIYDEPKAEDTCSASHFQAGYWTQGGSGTQLLGTYHAQQAIWRHQHPDSCQGKKYLVWQPCANGIGSTWHIMGQALAHALTMDRIFVLAGDPENAYYDEQWCGENENYHTCYFEATSSCTLDDVEAALRGTPLNVTALPAVRKPEDDVAHAAAIRLSCASENHHQPPAAFMTYLEASNINEGAYTYWWRAQSAAFLFRPNARTLAEIRARKQHVYKREAPPPGCISVHIRRGDKWIESSTTSDAAYVSAAEALYERGARTHGLIRHIFLSTEDPGAVGYFKGLQGWNVSYTHVQRKPDVHKSTIDYTREIGASTEMLNSLVNLDLALQCDGFVGTLSSNW